METSNVEHIFKVIDKLKGTIEKVQTKIIDINKKIHKFNQNSLLDTDNLYLSFQISLLNNEKSYYSEMMKLVEDKMFFDMVHIYEKILMLITSLETLDIEHDEEKNNIIIGVRKFQHTDVISCSEVMNLVSCSNSNLELVKRFIDLFEDYIKKLEIEHKQENIHCANMTVSLNIRKRHIEVEYLRYKQQLEDLLTYFVDCTKYISDQLDKQELINFLTHKNGTTEV